MIDSAESRVEYRSKEDLPLPFTDADVSGLEAEVEVDARVPKPFSPSLPPSWMKRTKRLTSCLCDFDGENESV